MSEAAWSLSATQLAQRLADGRLSSRDAVEAHLARIDALDPQLRAFTSVFATEARAEAARARHASGPRARCADRCTGCPSR
jgi:amidase